MPRIRSIVVPTDFSPLSEAAAGWAVSLARPDDAAVHLIHAVSFPLVVAPNEVSIPAAVREGIRSAAQERIEAARKEVEARGARNVTAEVADVGDAVRAIADAAAAHQADLVAMGTHGYGGLQHAFLGSVAERTIRSLEVPVLAVKAEPANAAKPISRILVAVDFSADSDRAVEIASNWAQRLQASVHLLHAFDLPRDFIPYASSFGAELERKIEQSVTERLEGIRERISARGVQASSGSRRGPASAAVVEVARDVGCDLIVMGTRGQTGLSHVLLGSVAERTLRLATCPVLVVKGDEAVRTP